MKKLLWGAGLAALVVATFLACSSLMSKVLQPPQVEEQDLRIAGLGLQQVDLELILAVRNPNPVDLPLQALEADIELFDKPFLSKKWEDLPVLTAHARTSVHLPFSLPWGDLLKMGAAFLGQKQIPYGVKGLVRVRGLEFPFQQKGEMAMPTPPQ